MSWFYRDDQANDRFDDEEHLMDEEEMEMDNHSSGALIFQNDFDHNSPDNVREELPSDFLTPSSTSQLSTFYDDRCTPKRAIVGTLVMLGLIGVFAASVFSRGFTKGEEPTKIIHSSTCVSDVLTMYITTIETQTKTETVTLPVETTTYTMTITGTPITIPATSCDMPAPTSNPLVDAQSIKGPERDHRDIKLTTLTNGLQVLAASDYEASKAAMAMSVGTGSFDDPSDKLGLAHLVEHMLFLGSKKYPDPSAFDEFISQRGSTDSNAGTYDDKTVYYFDVDPEYLNETAEIYSSIFIDPLLSESSVINAVKAVNSEHKKNLNNNDRKMWQILKSNSDPSHPFSRFSTGTLETLNNGVDIHKDMVDFYKKYYVAENMHLIIYAPFSVDEIISIAERHFSDVGSLNEDTEQENKEHATNDQNSEEESSQNTASDKKEDGSDEDDGGVFRRYIREVKPELKALHTYDLSATPFTSDSADGLGHLFTFKPDGTVSRLMLVWGCASMHYKPYSSPMEFINYVVGYEGKGSLMSTLKEKGWVLYLQAGSDTYSGFGIEEIDMVLTTEGVNHLDDIVALILNLFEKLSKETPAYIFDDLVTVEKILWKFPNTKHDAVASAQDMAIFLVDGRRDPIEFFNNPLKFNFDVDLLREVLGQFEAKSMMMFLLDSHANDTEYKNNEPWYNTNYKSTEFPSEWVEKWGNFSTTELELPVKNPFITSSDSIELLPVSTEPILLPNEESSPTVAVWYCKDNIYKTPSSQVYVNFRVDTSVPLKINTNTEVTMSSAKGIVLGHILSTTWIQMLTEYLYDAKAANYDLTIESDVGGMEFVFSGYSNGLQDLITSCLNRTLPAPLNKEKYSFAVDLLEQSLQSKAVESAYRQALYHLFSVLLKDFPTYDDQIKELQLVTFEELDDFRKAFFEHTYLEILVFGNVKKQNAINFSKAIQEAGAAVKDSAPVAFLKHFKWPTVDFTNSEKGLTFRAKQSNSEDPTSAAVCFLQAGERTIENNAMTRVIDQILKQKAFDVLRTTEALGYIVSLSHAVVGKSCGIMVIVQSSKDPSFVQSRIDNFLTSQKAFIENMDDEDFAENIDSLAKGVFDRVDDTGSEMWASLSEDEPIFDRYEQEIDFVKKQTKESVLNFYNTIIQNQLSIQVSTTRQDIIDGWKNEFEDIYEDIGEIQIYQNNEDTVYFEVLG